MGFKTVRGSQNKWWKDKGGKEATFELISRLNNDENIAVTVDGPSGPLHQVKNGVIKIAKLTILSRNKLITISSVRRNNLNSISSVLFSVAPFLL